mgnify:CR=1 FL=1
MATKIVTKNSSTAGSAPSASDLVQGELAVNVADKRLYTEDNAGNIVELGTNPLGEITANGGIALGDNDKATFGASDDLQIYHDGGHSYVGDYGTGNLSVTGNNLYLQNTSGETYLSGISDGAVSLYHNNAIKLATTATGIDITGTATMDGLTVSSDTNGDPVLAHLYNTSTGASAEATTYITNSASASDGLFLQTTGASFTTLGGFVQDSSVIGAGAGASGGLSIMTRANADIRFYTNGHTNERMRIDSSGNLLVGKTSLNTAVAGTEIRPNLTVITSAGDTPLYLRRNTNDGELINFRKDGTTVGSIGTQGGRLTIGDGDTGLRFADDFNNIQPFNVSTNVLRDNAIDLGSSAGRFKDLYLSGASYIPDVRSTGIQYFTHTTDARFRNSTGTERMRIDSSGRVLVGTTNTANIGIHTPNIVTDLQYGINDGSNIASFGLDRIYFNSSNYYVLSASSTGVRLINGATSWTTQSDENSKENIVELSNALTAVNAMRCVRYNLKSQTSGDVKIGFIAQDWQSSYPEVVATDTDGILGMNYTETIPVLLKAIQEQQTLIESLTTRIAALEE